MANSNDAQGACDMCVNYVYDEESDTYECLVDLDEDEMAQFVAYKRKKCPFFRFGDEYTIVRKQN